MEHARVTIESLAHGGDGVGRLPDGRTAFVSYACPGDEATVSVTEDHGRWVRATIETLEEPSPARVTPPCPYFGVCGGCQWQHIDYARQATSKQQMLVDAMTRIGGFTEPPVREIIASPAGYGYRNKIELAVSRDARGVSLGFMRAHSNEVLPIDACLLLPERATRLPRALSGAVRFLVSRGASGIVRASLRVSGAGEIAVDLWTEAGPFPRQAAARVIAESTGARSVTRTIVRGEHGPRDISRVEVLSGPATWRERLGGDRYAVSPPSFFQVNTKAAELLRTVALELLAPDGTERVADLYAGAGTFTLPIARAAGETVAVEASRYALSDLRTNLDAASLSADIVPGDAAYALKDLGHLDAALIDPPRSGLSEQALTALERTSVARLVYVSCDPATLARDAARLARSGYQLRDLVPVDLFPQTFHLESVALLERG